MNYDFSEYPQIRACLQQHIAYGSVLDFDVFVSELNTLLKELTKYRDMEDAKDYAQNSN